MSLRYIFYRCGEASGPSGCKKSCDFTLLTTRSTQNGELSKRVSGTGGFGRGVAERNDCGIKPHLLLH